MTESEEVRVVRRDAERAARLVETYADTIGQVKGLVVDGEPGQVILRFPHGVDLRVTITVDVES